MVIYKMMSLVAVDTFAFRCVVPPFRSLGLEYLVPIMSTSDDNDRARLIFDLFESMLAADKLDEFMSLSFDDASAVIEVWMSRS
jgi:hypothetical protein